MDNSEKSGEERILSDKRKDGRRINGAGIGTDGDKSWEKMEK